MALGLLLMTLGSITVLVVGLMALLGRLPRDHIAGIRTRRTMRSDESWAAAHRAGSPFLIFTAVAATAAGLAILPFALAGQVSNGFGGAVLAFQGALLAAGLLAAWLLGTRAANRLA